VSVPGWGPRQGQMWGSLLSLVSIHTIGSTPSTQPLDIREADQVTMNENIINKIQWYYPKIDGQIAKKSPFSIKCHVKTSSKKVSLPECCCNLFFILNSGNWEQRAGDHFWPALPPPPDPIMRGTDLKYTEQSGARDKMTDTWRQAPHITRGSCPTH